MQQSQQNPAQDARVDQAAEAMTRAAELARQVEARLAQEGRMIVTPGGPLITRGGSPTALYEAMRQQRNELQDQLERLEDQREELTDQLRSVPAPSGADQRGLEQRLASVDTRIADVERQLAEADAAVARAAAIPGAVQPPPPPPPQSGPPDEFWVVTVIFMFVVILPLTIAYARRIWRRGAAAVASIPQEIVDRFNRLDQAVDSVAIEVERIGEGQRFLTRMYAEQRGLGAGPAERVEVGERDMQRQARK